MDPLTQALMSTTSADDQLRQEAEQYISQVCPNEVKLGVEMKCMHGLLLAFEVVAKSAGEREREREREESPRSPVRRERYSENTCC